MVFIPATVLALLGSIYVIHFTLAGTPGFGPFTFRFTEMMDCDIESTNQIQFTGTRITKTNRTNYVYTGKLILLVPFDEAVSAHIELSSWGNGGWKSHYVDVDLEYACKSIMEYIPNAFSAFLGSISVNGCPLPVGEYEAKDMPLTKYQVNSTRVSSFRYGKYKGEITFFVGGETVGCKSVIVLVEPLKKQNG